MELVKVGHALHDTYPQVYFGYGGRAFNVNPELCDTIQGTFLGHDSRALVDIVGGLMARNSSAGQE
jgi:hypothetical protein